MSVETSVSSRAVRKLYEAAQSEFGEGETERLRVVLALEVTEALFLGEHTVGHQSARLINSVDEILGDFEALPGDRWGAESALWLTALDTILCWYFS